MRLTRTLTVLPAILGTPATAHAATERDGMPEPDEFGFDLPNADQVLSDDVFPNTGVPVVDTTSVPEYLDSRPWRFHPRRDVTGLGGYVRSGSVSVLPPVPPRAVLPIRPTSTC